MPSAGIFGDPKKPQQPLFRLPHLQDSSGAPCRGIGRSDYREGQADAGLLTCARSTGRPLPPASQCR